MSSLNEFNSETDRRQTMEMAKLFKKIDINRTPMPHPQSIIDNRITYAPQDIYLGTEARNFPAPMDDPDDLGFCEQNLVDERPALTCDNEFRMWLANRDRCDEGFHEFDPNSLSVVCGPKVQISSKVV